MKGNEIRMINYIRKAFALVIVMALILVSSSSYAVMNPEKLSRFFSNKNGDLYYYYQISDTNNTYELGIILSEIAEQNCVQLFGFVYNHNTNSLEEVNGYIITIDGRSYDISECRHSIILGLNVGDAKCPLGWHSALGDMLRDMAQAFRSVSITYKIKNGDETSQVTATVNDFSELREMAQSVVDSGYLDTDFCSGSSCLVNGER